MNCYRCFRELERIQAADVYPCFDCMKLIAVGQKSTISHPLARRKSTDWKIGNNVQTMKNQLWERQIEELYERWLAERILDE